MIIITLMFMDFIQKPHKDTNDQTFFGQFLFSFHPSHTVADFFDD